LRKPPSRATILIAARENRKRAVRLVRPKAILRERGQVSFFRPIVDGRGRERPASYRTGKAVNVRVSEDAARTTQRSLLVMVAG